VFYMKFCSKSATTNFLGISLCSRIKIVIHNIKDTVKFCRFEYIHGVIGEALAFARATLLVIKTTIWLLPVVNSSTCKS
jgi:hypothetical protein